LLLNEPSLHYQQLLLRACIEYNQINEAFSLYQSISSINWGKVTPQSITDWLRFTSLLGMLKMEGRSFYELTEFELEGVIEVATHCPTSLASAEAQSVLYFLQNKSSVNFKTNHPKKRITHTQLNLHIINFFYTFAKKYLIFYD
jgi:hypothetical protein